MFYKLNLEKLNSLTNDQAFIKLSGLHKCKDDIYKVNYIFNTKNKFKQFFIFYNVSGPNKNYITKTNFKLIGDLRGAFKNF